MSDSTYFQQVDVRPARGGWPSRNVLGVVRGADSQLVNRIILVSAHVDHLGALRPGDPQVDSIFNGADDNASGTAVLLGVAQLIAHGRPVKRSVLFVAHAAEERGMLGSAWFVANPPVRLDAIDLVINLDMVGRPATDSGGRKVLWIYGMSPADSGISSSLVRANRWETVAMHLEAPVGAGNDPDHLFCRSDQRSYAERGVPSLLFTTGLNSRYHTVQDEAGTLDAAAMGQIARIAASVVRSEANRVTPLSRRRQHQSCSG
jgi:Zn-dependent M28 family amino/carboxypeptidase